MQRERLAAVAAWYGVLLHGDSAGIRIVVCNLLVQYRPYRLRMHDPSKSRESKEEKPAAPTIRTNGTSGQKQDKPSLKRILTRRVLRTEYRLDNFMLIPD